MKKLFPLLLLITFVACEESNTPVHFKNEAKALEECTKACKEVGRNVESIHTLGVGCTCK